MSRKWCKYFNVSNHTLQYVCMVQYMALVYMPNRLHSLLKKVVAIWKI